MVYPFLRFPTIAFAMFALLLGCAPRGQMGYLTALDTAEDVERVFAVTNRTRDETGGFGRGRSNTLSYLSYDISIPRTHTPGEIEWPRGEVDASKDFALVDQTQFSSVSAFRTELNRAMSLPGARNEQGKREVSVFVHGFNNNFAEGLYRFAQLKHDYGTNVPSILYSWPSAAQPTLYVYDRDSTLFSRNGLEELLIMLANSNVDKITLVGHSMGTQLLMETLRQIYRNGNSRLQSKIAGVILLSPDIDIDVFNSQVAEITPLPTPFMIFGSRDDGALKLSSFISGEPTRLGNNMDPNKIENPDVTTYDLTDFGNGADLNHFILATSTKLIELIQQIESGVIEGSEVLQAQGDPFAWLEE